MDPHPVIVTIGDNRDYVWVLLYSDYTTITGWGVLLTRITNSENYALSAHVCGARENGKGSLIPQRHGLGFKVWGLGFSKDITYWGVGMLGEFATRWGFLGGFGFRVKGWKG